LSVAKKYQTRRTWCRKTLVTRILVDPTQITTITAFSVHALANQTTSAILKKVANGNASLTLIVRMIRFVPTTVVKILV